MEWDGPPSLIILRTLSCTSVGANFSAHRDSSDCTAIMEQTSDNNDLQSDSPNISWPLRRRGGSGSRAIEPDHDNSPKGHTNGNLNPSLYNRDNLPGQEKALDGISLRAFLLGISLGVGTVTTGLLAYHQEHIWRAPFFLAALSLFHFLEYYVTATYNTRYANISAFLLSQNGQAYNIAHTAAFTECILTSIFLPTWQTSLSRPSVVAFGCMMIVVGQVTRSIAMAQAGTNFNHTVQTRKNQGHELVTSGIYGYLRHPSYFGFFWCG